MYSLGSEREALEKFLDAQREGLIRKIEGLDDAMARQAPTRELVVAAGAGEALRDLGAPLVPGRHGRPRAARTGGPRSRPEPRDADLMVDDSDTVDHWVAHYREQIEQSRAVAASMDLDTPCARNDIIECNVRYVMFHMIEETARHAGHADIIRETLDGSRGI